MPGRPLPLITMGNTFQFTVANIAMCGMPVQSVTRIKTIMPYLIAFIVTGVIITRTVAVPGATNVIHGERPIDN